MTDTVTVRPMRSLGGLTADAVVEEAHEDRLAITHHPVEQGAAITDHAFKEPASVHLVYGWSDASPDAPGVRTIYEQLLALQASRKPLEVLTGKRRYTDMLITAIGLTTNAETENALLCSIVCEQVILVSTSSTTAPPAKEVQAAPEKTAAVQDQGTKQLAPAPQANTSALAQLAGR